MAGVHLRAVYFSVELFLVSILIFSQPNRSLGALFTQDEFMKRVIPASVDRGIATIGELRAAQAELASLLVWTKAEAAIAVVKTPRLLAYRSVTMVLINMKSCTPVSRQPPHFCLYLCTA